MLKKGTVAPDFKIGEGFFPKAFTPG